MVWNTVSTARSPAVTVVCRYRKSCWLPRMSSRWPANVSRIDSCARWTSRVATSNRWTVSGLAMACSAPASPLVSVR